MNKLKPCPFCGSNNIRIAGDRGGIRRIECMPVKGACGANILAKTDDEAIVKWNTRPAPPVEPETCKTCGGSGTVDFEPDDIQGDIQVPCPACKPEANEEQRVCTKQEIATTENVDVCKCGVVMFEADDYDTLGSKDGICCPRCGNEEFESIHDKYEKQLKGYAELLGSANHDVEELTKYAADKEKECKQLKNTIVRILDMSAVRNRCECGRPTGLGAIHCCAEQVLEKDNE